jgi:hypothetical protein
MMSLAAAPTVPAQDTPEASASVENHCGSRCQDTLDAPQGTKR